MKDILNTERTTKIITFANYNIYRIRFGNRQVIVPQIVSPKIYIWVEPPYFHFSEEFCGATPNKYKYSYINFRLAVEMKSRLPISELPNKSRFWNYMKDTLFKK